MRTREVVEKEMKLISERNDIRWQKLKIEILLDLKDWIGSIDKQIEMIREDIDSLKAKARPEEVE